MLHKYACMYGLAHKNDVSTETRCFGVVCSKMKWSARKNSLVGWLAAARLLAWLDWLETQKHVFVCVLARFSVDMYVCRSMF